YVRPVSSWKVAVFEHQVIPPKTDMETREEALDALKLNSDVYHEAVLESRSKGVKMIVFPEYGLYDINTLTRTRMDLMAEKVPHPKHGHRNPCDEPEYQTQSSEMLRTFSCMAKENDMYMVVNMAGREPCRRATEPECPGDKQLLYNTNVAFNNEGDVVARYYKTHLFWEEGWFNSSKNYEMALWDTPIGKFGTFMCFDFQAVQLIEQYNVRHIAYPASWVNLPPIYQSIQSHSAFARFAKINLLAASVHRLETSTYGSGIYSPNGAEIFYFRPDIPKSKLLVAEILPIHVKKPEQTVVNFDNPVFPSEDDDVQDLFDRGDFAFLKYKRMTTRAGTVEVCQKSFCCKARYAVKDRFKEVYAVGVYDGLLSAGANNLYFQICTVIQCPHKKCGLKISKVRTHFKYLNLRADGWLDRYVFPSYTVMYNNYIALDPFVWNYTEAGGIETKPGTSTPLHSANLVARIYAKDSSKHVHQSHPIDEGVIKMAVKYMLYVMAAYVYAAS
uniref:Symplectin n=1 Tax=Sthenoteuthis oualaniensis TaxID=34553 RepID=SYMPP_STHOU|nr:RecName: Full=Symplectin [Sthenoteuthis oualaniensis]